MGLTHSQVVAEEMTLKIASYWLCGCGPRIMAEDFSSTNFAEENAAWLAMGVPQMLVMTLLWSILACVLGRDTARTLVESTSQGLRFFVESLWHLVAYVRAYVVSCCWRQRPSEPQPKEARKPKTKHPATGSSCGNCSCLPCEALLARRPAGN
eukprot:Skav214544  [mRNA]  locus=scaffold410:638050:638747:+ [translate_table: standard]